MMKKLISIRCGIIFIALLAFISCRSTRNNDPSVKTLPDLSVEAEDVIYEYVDPNNGSGPYWCLGSPILVRNKENVLVSGIETVYQYKMTDNIQKTVNNLRWMLYEREDEGWKLKQGDPKDRTREPSPIGLLSDGRLIMSVNPTLDSNIEKSSTLNQPRILEFSVENPEKPFNTLMPEWKGNPAFSQHSYRTFSVDRENNEFILFQNIGSLHAEWAFYDRNRSWFTGQLKWLPRINDPIPPFNDINLRLVYPVVFLKNREVHFCGNAAINQWSRIHTMEDALKYGIKDIQGQGGRIAGMRFRKIYYAWTPDITKEGFSSWLEIANSYENGESIRVQDMWVDREGIVHLIWHKHPIYKEIRDKYFPDLKRVWGIYYVQIRNGEVLMNKTLLETGDGITRTVYNDLLADYSITFCRFQILPDNRIFVIFHITGKDKAGESRSENRLMELYRDGRTSMSVPVPLKYPMSVFFTATPRGGSLPSSIIDLAGSGSDGRSRVRYARIKMTDK